jgi:ribosome assembly protein YihI (activator of Der GTPase)
MEKLARALVGVPKAEIDAKARAHERKKKRRGKRTRAKH